MANQLGLVNPLFADSAALPATFENSKGYFESRSLLQANDRILSFFECSWDFPWLGQPDFAAAQSRAFLAGLRADLPIHTRDDFWIDKDPRLCLTSEAYRHVLLRQIPLIAIVRHPIEVAASLQARDGIPPDRGLALWAAYNLALLGQESGAPRLCLSFESFASPATWPLQRLSSALSALWDEWLEPAQLARLSPALVEQVIGRSYADGQVRQRAVLQTRLTLPPGVLLAETAVEAWQGLQTRLLAGDLTPGVAQALLGPLVARVLACPGAIPGWRSGTDQLRALRAESRQRELELEASRSSLRSQTQVLSELSAAQTRLQQQRDALEGRHSALSQQQEHTQERLAARRERNAALQVKLDRKRQLIRQLRHQRDHALALLGALRQLIARAIRQI
ncbi:hypothetical protein IQ216_06695 [Cyanobium sp. LEGE 06143]|uniref:hypothetical protein n=1 Tax=Cyanobium sp. LEGE 06143 TaxID=945727 RepID=UPI001880B191|nr:hypothetical protein [Cyanobium sp. LEGE 06143]MBE9172779.1 hypothetical protein [Cyanobium sp. LEGE 06143]